MSASLVLPATIRAELASFLLGDESGRERLAVLLAGAATSHTGTRLLARELVPAADGDYHVQSWAHLEMQPAFWARVAKRARGGGDRIVVAHSHPGFEGEPFFSPSDTYGEGLLMPKLAARAPGPHATLVVSPGGMRARLHGAESRPLAVVGEWPSAKPAHLGSATHTGSSAQFARQVLALGESGHGAVRSLSVGVVGAGGTGSHVVQQLLHLGVRRLIVVDPDLLERSNLSRVVGATADDIGRPKVDVAVRTARSVGGTTEVVPLAASVLDSQVLAELGEADVVFGCTDTQWSRLALNWLAQTRYVPVIDLGVEMAVGGTRGARVAFAGPADACLWCSGFIDERALRGEQLPEALRAAQVQRGYIPDADVAQPAVVSVNGVVASLAVSELLSRLGLRGAEDHPSVLLYRLADGTVRRVAGSRGRCAMCTLPSLGAGDALEPPILRPRKGSTPSTAPAQRGTIG